MRARVSRATTRATREGATRAAVDKALKSARSERLAGHVFDAVLKCRSWRWSRQCNTHPHAARPAPSSLPLLPSIGRSGVSLSPYSPPP